MALKELGTRKCLKVLKLYVEVKVLNFELMKLVGIKGWLYL